MSDVVNSVQFVLILFLDITLFIQICLIFNTHETVFTNLKNDTNWDHLKQDSNLSFITLELTLKLVLHFQSELILVE